jgi:signal transduction histidine kinase
LSPFNSGHYSELIDKLALFLCSFALSHSLFPQTQQVLPFLLALIFIALLGYLDPGPKRRMLLGIYALACIPLPPLTLYLPALAHEVLYSEPPWSLFIPALPLGLFPFLSGWPPFLTLLPVLALGLLLKSKARHSDRQKEQVHRFQDHLQQTRQDLARLQQTQEEQQENSAWLATLKERNRIARDIHDNVGHILTSALLQTAALLSGPLTNEQKSLLSRLKATLGEGLDRIRSSVHQLHESPVDLETEIKRLLQSLTTCTCHQTIELLGIPHIDHRQCLLAVIREALSNVIRHSDATELTLTLKEHPAFYQLAIADNGRVRPAQNTDGLGLRSMEERVSLLGGRLHITRDKGFTLFITLPKG